MADGDVSLKKAVVASLVWKILERGGHQIIALVVQIIMARLLAPEDFGALAIILVFVNIGGVIVNSGLNTALVQSPIANTTDFTTVFWLSLAISCILFVCIFLAAPQIAGFYSMNHLIWPLRILAIVLIVNAYNGVQVAFVQRLFEYRKIFIATIVSVVSSGTIGIAAACADAGIWALVIQQLTYQLSNCVALALQIPWKPTLVFNQKRARELYGFGWKLLISGLLNTAYRSLSDLIIGKQFSAFQLGYVSQGKKYPEALGSMLDGTIQPIMLGAVSRVQDNLPYVKRLVRRALKTSTFIIVPFMICFAVVAEPTVRFLLGEQWLPCVWFLQVYCFDYALMPIHTANLQALNGMGYSDLFLKLELIKKAYGLAFMLFAAFVLKSVYWMVGFTVITGIISTFVNAWPNRKVISYRYSEQVRDICPAFILSLVAAAIAWPLCIVGLPDAMLIPAQVAIMACAYLGLSKLFHVEAFEYLIKTVKDVLHQHHAEKED